MLPPNLQLRPLHPTDQPAVFALLTVIYPPHYAHLWTDDASAYLDRNYGPAGFRADLERSGNEYYFVQYRNENKGILLINHGIVNPDEPNVRATYLQKLYLHDDLRGRGIGGALIDWVTAAAGEHGNAAVWLETMAAGPARRIYERLGFVETGAFDLGAPLVVPAEAPMLRMQRAIPYYLPQVRRQFAYYRALGQGALDQLSPDQLFWLPAPDANSVGTIVKHLHGNMRSRFTDFLTTDGEKDFRDREGEFAAVTDAAEVQRMYTEGWEVVERTLAELTESDLRRTVFIRSKGHTVLEAVNRQLAHYAYHIGQIVLLGRVQRGAAWKSLSIPRGESAAFNAASRGAGRRRGHYTEGGDAQN